MAQLQDTAGDLRRAANFFKGVIAAADVIERIGSLDNATAEAKAALAAAEKDRDQALTELADAKAKGAKAVKAAQDKAEKVLADAQLLVEEAAAKTMSEARASANDMITKAEAQASDVMAKANAAVAGAEQAHHDLSVKRTALAAEVADLEAAAKAAQAEHDKLTKALEKIKAQFKIGD